MSARIEGHAEIGGPEWFVDTWKVDIHLIECLFSVMSWFDPQVSHPAQPIVHPLYSPVSIFMEEEIVASDVCVESPNVWRNITIIH